MFTVRLTVEDDTGQIHSVQKFVNLFRSLSLETVSSLSSSVMTHLMAAKGAAAQITMTGRRTFPVAGGTPASHRYPATPGTNVLEGVVTAPLDEPARWRFDFTASKHFVPGSLRLVGGTEVSRDARSIVVRVSGRPGERVRIEYELRR
jgi:hypothetical protein